MLPAVLAAAVVGFVAGGPGRRVAAHHGIDAVLAVLVWASAATVPEGGGRRLALAWRPIALTVAVGTVSLPLLATLLGLAVAAGPLRQAVLAIGVSPAEVATVAISGLAGADVGLAAALLVASTAASVVVAGPVLALVGGHGTDPVATVSTLVVVVAVPLVIGLVTRRAVRSVTAAVELIALAAVVALVYLVSAGAHLALAYLPAMAAMVALLAASAGAGALVGRSFGTGGARTAVLHLSMRDFAVASGIATAAFGPAAAAPLGIYGVLVMAWGGAAARHWRDSPPGRSVAPGVP